MPQVNGRNLNARQDTRYKFPGIHYTLEEMVKHLALPSHLNFANWAGPTLDQGTYGDCVANGTAGLFYTISHSQDHIIRVLSRSALYAQIENQLYPPAKDQGAESGDGLLIWHEHGWIPEAVRPYPPNGDPKELLAPVAEDEWRKDCPLVTFARVNTDILSIKKAISSRKAALFGGRFAQSWTSQTNADGSLPLPDTDAGGHLWFSVGYDDNIALTDDGTGFTSQGAFISRNSWGTQYGYQPEGAVDSGYFLMPYYLWDDFKQFVPQDVYVATKVK